MDVLAGMHRLLSAQRVELMSFEYAYGWDRHVYKDLQAGNKRLPKWMMTNLTRSEVGGKVATLKAFQEKLSTYG